MFIHSSFVLLVVTLIRFSKPALHNSPKQNEKLLIRTRIDHCSEGTRNLVDLSNICITGDINSFTVGGKIELLQKIIEPAKFTFNSTARIKDRQSAIPFHPVVLRNFCQLENFYIIGFYENIVPRILSCPVEPGFYTIKNTTIDLSLHVGNELVKDWRTRFLMETPTVTACVEIVYECQAELD